MAVSIATAIQDGTFPDDEATLSSELNASSIPPLLASIQHAKDDLRSTVRGISRKEAGDVDGWIAQAKKVQEDIARCKADARNIVLEHQRVETYRSTRNETRSKVTLLEDEIAFNQALQKEIDLISEIFTALNQADSDIRQRQLIPASQALPGLAGSIDAIASGQSRSLLTKIHRDLGNNLRAQLLNELEQHCYVKVTANSIELSLSGAANKNVQDSILSVEETLDSLDRLGLLQETQRRIAKQIEACLLPHLHVRSKRTIAKAEDNGSILHLTLSQEQTQPLQMLEVSKDVLGFVHERAPRKLHNSLVQDTATLVVPKLIENWLDTALPVHLDQLKDLAILQERVQEFATWLGEQHIKQAKSLDLWVRDVPKAWLVKRRTASLDAVRDAFKLATGATRQVERTERQRMVVEPKHEQETADDAWAEDWGDEDNNVQDVASQPDDTTEDGSDAWGFDTDDQSEEPQSATAQSQKKSDEDDGDGWGWGDDDTATTKPSPILERKTPMEANGTAPTRASKEEDVVLTENYFITDIPDYMLEQIGKDTLDLHTLRASPEAYFKASSGLASGMQSLPSSTLAMFRAVAPAMYSHGTTMKMPLSQLNLYNDALYLAQKLEEDPDLSTYLRKDIQNLAKFARQSYSSELSTQRQILSDLLDNAQGFIGCTRQPSASVCETAVASTVDYLRALHTQWSSILSPSHLAQSIGSLLNNIMSKMIKEIEDMEDISEPESQKLLGFMTQISNLESLFVSPTANTAETREQEQEQHPSSTIAVYVSSFFRFRYLEQILESSLVEIKYLWQEQGLSVEFSADEVVDLIKALFSESSHRRNAIQTIRYGT